jgi:hypothetical protein
MWVRGFLFKKSILRGKFNLKRRFGEFQSTMNVKDENTKLCCKYEEKLKAYLLKNTEYDLSDAEEWKFRIGKKETEHCKCTDSIKVRNINSELEMKINYGFLKSMLESVYRKETNKNRLLSFIRTISKHSQSACESGTSESSLQILLNNTYHHNFTFPLFITVLFNQKSFPQLYDYFLKNHDTFSNQEFSEAFQIICSHPQISTNFLSNIKYDIVKRRPSMNHQELAFLINGLWMFYSEYKEV